MTKIKICGITNLTDAFVAVEAGADLLGFIFYEPSPRYISPEAVQEFVAAIKSRNGEAEPQKNQDLERFHLAPQFIGVFVNAPLETVNYILDFCQLDAVQLHGEEPPEFVQHFNGRAFKAMRPQSQVEADEFIHQYQSSPPCPSASPLPCFLLDAYHPKLYGGTGRVTDWTIAASIARRYPIMLAGSLTPENVVEAIAAVRPWGVDVSSGVEAKKGKKDHQKVRTFINKVKNIQGAIL